MKTNLQLYTILVFVAGLAWGQADVNRVRQMPGIATAQNSAELASNISSQLLEVNVIEGARVKAGQRLAALDYRAAKSAYEAAISAARDTSQLDLASIDMAEQKKKLERIRDAQQSGASNAAELEKATNDYKRTVAKHQLEKHRLDQAKLNEMVLKYQLEAYLIRAPFDGVVTDIRIKVGNLVEPNEPIASISQYSVLHVELNLPLELFGKLTKGDSYEMYASKPVSRLLKGTLTYVSPVVDSASQTFKAKFEIPNNDLTLPSGFAVELSKHQFSILLKNSKQDLAGN